LLVLRVGLAAILLFHGAYKLTHGVDWIKGPLGHVGLPGFLAYGTYVAELVAPIMLIVGAWTRIGALVIAIDMVMALVLVMRPQILAIKPSGGGWGIELEALILLTALALVFAGGGRFSVVPNG